MLAEILMRDDGGQSHSERRWGWGGTGGYFQGLDGGGDETEAGSRLALRFRQIGAWWYQTLSQGTLGKE